MTPRTALAAALLLLSACGSGGEQSAAPPADSAVAAPPSSPNVIGQADDRARRMADSANAAVQARQQEVEALGTEAAGGN